MKIIVNRCYGGFGLSDAAYERLIELGIPLVEYKEGRTEDHTHQILKRDEKSAFTDQAYWDTWTREERTHPLLVQVVEELGKAANNSYSDLEVIEIPDDVEWQVEEYDGREWIAEKHRTW